MVKEAIVLAGGLGTRLRDTVPDLPKCMAPVAGRPFLYHVINHHRMQGIERFIFSLGYKHELIEAYLQQQFATMQYKVVIEKEPLGTGGAIKLACEQVTKKNVLIANGDTLFKATISALISLHEQKKAHCTVAIKPMQHFDRYGVVDCGADGAITGFKEKQFYQQGNINGGVYILDSRHFLSQNWPAKFSFEKEYLEKTSDRLFASVQDGYFIDIGIPQDYERAQKELARPPLKLSSVDKTWTLFLDRDGVINEDKDGSYIFSPDEFIFTKGAPALFKKLADLFGRIIIITNQRGVGKGLMTEETLKAIHEKMKAEVKKAGGHIDGIFYCTSVYNDDPLRKPNPGMAVAAAQDIPGIDFSKSIMVGNNISDMLFGKNAGMHTIFVKSTRPDQSLPHPEIDLAFDSLADFAESL